MATVTNIAKNSAVAATGGAVFFGWLFWFTRQQPATGSSLTNLSRTSSPALINQSKN